MKNKKPPASKLTRTIAAGTVALGSIVSPADGKQGNTHSPQGSSQAIGIDAIKEVGPCCVLPGVAVAAAVVAARRKPEDTEEMGEAQRKGRRAQWERDRSDAIDRNREGGRSPD